MSYELLKVVADFAGLFISIVAICVVIFDRYGKSAREMATRQDVSEVWEAIDQSRVRIASVEANHKSLPTHQDLATLRASVSELKGVVSQLNTSLKMVNQHLLDRNS